MATPSMIPGGSTNNTNGIWSNFSEGFNFGNGGMFNGFNQSAIPASTSSAQGQGSGGFNTIPGMPSVGGSGTFGLPGIPGQAPGSTNILTSLFSSSVPGNPAGPGTTNGPTGLPQIQGSALKDLYGHGVGNALAQFLNSGAGFNQGVVSAEQQAALPLEARGDADIMNAMGSHGLGSSSTAAIGLGDFESQFNSQMNNMFAQQYEQSVQNYLNVLMGVKGDAKEQQAQSGNWMSVLGGIAEAAIPLFA